MKIKSAIVQNNFLPVVSLSSGNNLSKLLKGEAYQSNTREILTTQSALVGQNMTHARLLSWLDSLHVWKYMKDNSGNSREPGKEDSDIPYLIYINLLFMIYNVYHACIITMIDSKGL